MSTKSDYTPEEWNLVMSGPVVAGSMVVMSDPSIFGSIKESFRIAQTIQKAALASDAQVIRDIGLAYQNKAKPQTPDLPRDRGKAGAMDVLLATVQEAANTVSDHDPQEGEAYRRFLVEVAQATAEASKEGGFLGIGAVRVSADEEAAIERLRTTLGTEI